MFVQHAVISAAINIGILFLALWLINYSTKYSVRKALHIMAGPTLYYSLRHMIFTFNSAIMASMIPLSSSILFYLAKQQNIKPLIQLIQRSSSSQINGVIEYGILWALWPISKVYNLEDYILPGLICLTLGDGFAGFGENFKSGQLGKSQTGSLFFIVASAIGLKQVGYNHVTCIILSVIGSIAEYNVTGDNDNIIIVATVSFTQFLMKMFM